MSKPRQTSSVYAVLGVLAQAGPISGYGIRAYVALSASQFWSESYGQIYPSLKFLVNQKWATVTKDRRSPRAKQLYTITPKGRAELTGWLAGPPRAETPRNELILKVFLGDQSPECVTVMHLQTAIEHSRARLKQLRELEAKVRQEDRDAPSLPNSIMAIRADIHQQRARIQWARESLELLNAPVSKPHHEP